MSSASRKKLVAIDLDGTLLNQHHNLSERSVKVLRELSAKGVTISIATGRSKKNIERYVRELALSQPSIPVICYNGAYGLQYVARPDGSYDCHEIFANSLPHESTRKLVEFGHRHGYVLQYYNGRTGEVYAVPRNETHIDLLKRYEDLVDNAQTVIDSYDSAFSICQSAKVLLMTEDADHLIAAAHEELDAREFTIIRGSPHPFFVEFLRPDVTKGSGLKLLCEHIGVDMKEVVAFGDGDNDREMLQLAGLGVAMKNAKQAAKEVADSVIEWTNDEDGVARQLELLFKDGVFSQIDTD
eukprot:gene32570-39382_t